MRIMALGASLCVTTAAMAADATMTINMVGDWCFELQEGNEITYALPSWTDGSCTKILSVTPYSFSGEGTHCEPVQVREKKDCAPSGCAYIDTIVAMCQPDGPVTKGARTLFEFSRYKGHLTVTTK